MKERYKQINAPPQLWWHRLPNYIMLYAILFGILFIAAGWYLSTQTVKAKPNLLSSYQTAALAQYPTLSANLQGCKLCHVGGVPGLTTVNSYGTAYAGSGYNFVAIEAADSDGDGSSNITEINAGTNPGDPLDKPAGGGTPATPLTSVTISGNRTGLINTSYTFNATISPATATTPITYTWSPAPAAGQGTANATYNWTTIGTKAISLIAANPSGQVVGNHSIIISSSASSNTIPITGGQLSSIDGSIILQIPNGALANSTTITITTSSTANQPAATGFTFAGHSFSLTASDINGPVTNFNQPVTITLTYADTDWQGTRISDETSLRVYWWNGTQWQVECNTCVPDTVNNSLTIQLTHTTNFALMGITKNVTIYLPLITKRIAPPAQPTLPPSASNQYTNRYVVLAWTDMGMHPMDASYADFALAPPYSTIRSQVFRKGGENPSFIGNARVEYSIVDNTYSVDKTDFWSYAQQLYGLNLSPEIGLTTRNLNGFMTLGGGFFEATGIPVTEFNNSYPTTSDPYQFADIVAKDAGNGVLASTRIVVPVSTEVNCSNCHYDNGIGNAGIATGSYKQNILTLHDQRKGTALMASRPVLCAGCHSSKANGYTKTGVTGIAPLSRAMHNKHTFMDDNSSTSCYQCHPGQKTKQLRDIHISKTCQNCHGSMSSLASVTRTPWVSMPRCENCHASAQSPGALYKDSIGHKGVFCMACHGTQHAIYPTVTAKDNFQSNWVQGYSGKISNCAVCHNGGGPDDDGFPHLSRGGGDNGGDDDD